jgi:DNA-binding transcriptional MerR regulator
MRIQEVEERTGITSHNIRYYEKENLICPQRNLTNKYREYTEDDIQKLNTIKLLRMINIPIRNIREYFEGNISLEDVLKSNLCLLEEEEHKLRESIMLNRHLLEQDIDTEIPLKILNKILSDEATYIKTLEQIKRQDVWNIRKFMMWQVISIVGWIGASILAVIFFFTMMKDVVGKGTLILFALLIALMLVIIVKTIYHNEKEQDNL